VLLSFEMEEMENFSATPIAEDPEISVRDRKRLVGESGVILVELESSSEQESSGSNYSSEASSIGEEESDQDIFDPEYCSSSVRKRRGRKLKTVIPAHVSVISSGIHFIEVDYYITYTVG